jgi:hypothetical protein
LGLKLKPAGHVDSRVILQSTYPFYKLRGLFAGLGKQIQLLVKWRQQGTKAKKLSHEKNY